MKRRDFVHLSGLTAGLAWMPGVGNAQEWSGSLTPVPAEDRKQLADAALAAARAGRRHYCRRPHRPLPATSS